MMRSIATLMMTLAAWNLTIWNVIARRDEVRKMANQVREMQRIGAPREMQSGALNKLEKAYRGQVAQKLFLTFLSVYFFGALLTIGCMMPYGESLSMQTLSELGNKAMPFGCALGLTVTGCVMIGIFVYEKVCDKIDKKHDGWVIPWMLLGLPILLIGALWMTHM
ncbi:hypothetical protein [Lacticaseibacillus suibinensis]|uniref:hypothetical protein n=1 Tax=Lacticaseibacillus suibinensis TaxID=2486011 RepID=UPI000F788160|nr:hypothetical protein [Lacticaseibacillus suibinensis]